MRKLKLFILVLPILQINITAQTWEFVGLDSMVIKQLYVSGDTIWVGTAVRNGISVNSGLYRSTNNGISWMQIDSSLGNGNIVGIEFRSSNEIFLIKGVGTQSSFAGTLYKSTNTGKTWQQINEFESVNHIKTSPFNKNEIYVKEKFFVIGGFYEVLYRSNNAGETWVVIGNFPASSHGRLISFNLSFIDSNAIYAAVDDNMGSRYLFKSSNKGNSWTLISTPPVTPAELMTDIFLSDRLYLFADYQISDDGGLSWYDGDFGLTNHQDYLSFYMNENLPGQIYNLRRDGLFKTSNDTINWQLVEGSDSLPLNLGGEGFNFGDVGQLENVFYYNNLKNLFIGTAKGVYKKDLVTGLKEIDNYQPAEFILHQNYPNPFNPITIITYHIPEKGFITLKVFDVLGNEVNTLVAEDKLPGNYQIEFFGANLSSGVYFYILSAILTNGNRIKEGKKMILIK